MGRLIPAGTGMEFYRNVSVDRDETVDESRRERDMDDFPEITGGLDMPVTTRAAVATGGDGEAEDASGEEE